ncbi:MAG TPA: DNA primase [Desulfocapsa sulfexigens]|nr:DNA primase [Desulfocapsa sulfexigens]
MNDFTRIKQVLDLNITIPAETGLSMGKSHLEKCPFCDGHTCFSIHKNTETFTCFQCDLSGDVFDFIKEYHGYSENESLKYAANLANIPLKQKQKIVRLSKTEKVLKEAAEYYHQHMKINGAKEYFINRRGHSMPILKRLMVGFSDGKLCDHLLEIFSPEVILNSGLVRKDEKKGHLYDFFSSGLAIFPHYYNGRVVQFTIKDPSGKKTPYQLPTNKRHKKWSFYNQDALYRFEEIILVEGENDTISVLDSGIKQILGITGQISDDQIQVLKHQCNQKHLYLWMDNDFDLKKPMSKGHGYVRKICQSLPGINIRIFIYPEEYNDPDEFIHSLPKLDRRKAVCTLRESAVDYLTWEILQAGKLKSLETKLNHLKGFSVFQQISNTTTIEQQIYIEKIEDIGFEKKAITQQLEVDSGLRLRIADYLENLSSKRDANPNIIADMIHDYFSKGGRFFHDPSHKVYLLYRHNIYEVGNNRPFNALIKKRCGLLPTEQPGRSVWESLASEGYNSGNNIEVGSWLFTDRTTDSVFLNLNSPNNTILKLTPTGINEIQNGLNDDNVLLKSTGKIKPFNFLPETDVPEAISLLRELLFDNLSCEKEQKHLLVCWFISCFLSDFSPHVSPLLKAEGETACGKTTGARLIEYLLYGNEHLGEISVAGAYADASANPLLVIDNLENNDIKNEMMKFLLLVATRGSKVKRKGGTESDVTEESPKALVMITAIEPFVKSELINRTFAVQFSKKFQNPSFIDDEATRQILRKRDIIISGILKMIQKDILPNLERRKSFITALNVQHKGHSKERMNAYLALMMLILEKLLKYWDVPSPEAQDIWQQWLFTQDNLAREHEVSSNDILKLLDGLVREYRLRISESELKPHMVYGFDKEVFQYKHPEYGITIIMTQPVPIPGNEDYTESWVEFESTSNDLVYAFGRFCKNNNLQNPYSSAAIFGSRLTNDKKLLKKGDWELIPGKNREGEKTTHFKTIHGKRFLKFRHRLIR